MKRKYDIDQSFGTSGKIYFPFNKFILFMAKLFLPSPNTLFNKWNITYKKVKLLCGKTKFNVYFVYPTNLDNKKSPALIYLHGGGFGYKANSGQLRNFLTYLKEGSLIGVLIDYTVAKQYPLANNEIEIAFNYLLSNYEKYNIDKNNISLIGDSAGGYLCLDLINKIDYHFKSAMFLFPVVDQNIITESKIKFDDTPLWNSRLNKKMWKIYGGKQVIPTFIDTIDFNKVGAAYLEVCEFDCLRDEGLIIGEKIKGFNIPFESYLVKNAMHGYDGIRNSPISKKMEKIRIEFIKKYI